MLKWTFKRLPVLSFAKRRTEVIREEVNFSPFTYEGAWDSILRFYKEHEDEIAFGVISRAPFQSIEQYNYLKDKLEDMDVMLLLPEEEGEAGSIEVFELQDRHFYYFKDLNREMKLGHLPKVPENMEPRNKVQDCSGTIN